MAYNEYLGWVEYFARRPPGWREDQRAAVIALSLGGGKNTKPSDIFPSLKEMERREAEANQKEKGFLGKFLGQQGHKLTGGAKPEDIFNG